MSKSEWKDLPDCTVEEDYKFLSAATPPEVWAWEFLRRDPKYREDWQRVADLKKKFGKSWGTHAVSLIYEPPCRKGESEWVWKARIVAKGKTPVISRLDVYLARKWGLKALYDPRQPKARFIMPGRDFPRMIVTPDDFFDLTEEEEIEGDLFQRIMNGYIVLAFDLRRPVGGQGEAAERLIRAWRKKMLAAGRIKKAEGHAGKIDKWKRHLRTLDARRMNPPATYAEISKILGAKKSAKATMTPQKEGEKFVRAARQAMKNYRKILLFRGTPGKITP